MDRPLQTILIEHHFLQTGSEDMVFRYSSYNSKKIIREEITGADLTCVSLFFNNLNGDTNRWHSRSSIQY